MKDFSCNLPTWAYWKGYRLEGNSGTYDELRLKKNFVLRKVWGYQEIPNIIEIGSMISEIESEETLTRC